MSTPRPEPQTEAEAGTAFERQEWQDVAKGAVAGMTPADKGWILAFVILFAVFQISNYLIAIERSETEFKRSERLVTYFNKLEDTRAMMEENRSQEIRRSQEVIKELTQALGRRHEYEGRAEHEGRILEKATTENVYPKE